MTTETLAADQIENAVIYARAFRAHPLPAGTTEAICAGATDRLALLKEPSGRIRYLLDGKRSTRAACVEALAGALQALPSSSYEPTEQVCTAGLDVVHVDAADIDHAENAPCVTCGRTDMPMHTSGECPDCFDALPTVPGLSYAEQETISEANYHAFVAMGVFPAQTFDAAPTRKQRRAERVRQNRLRKIERKARETKAVEAMTDKLNAFTQPGKLRRCGRTLRGAPAYSAENPNRADRIAARIDWHALTGAPASTLASLREQLRLASL